MRDKLVSSGVDVSSRAVVAGPTGHAIIQVAPRGENSIIIFPGANDKVSADLASETFSPFAHGDILLLQNEIPNISDFIYQGSEWGLSVIFNPAPFTDAVHDYPLKKVDTLILNENEARSLLGHRRAADTPANLVQGLWDLTGVERIILTLGAAGVLCLAEGSLTAGESDPAEAVDTTAAGDTFIGYYVAAVAEGADCAAALETATAAAATCVSSHDAMDSIPWARDLP